MISQFLIEIVIFWAVVGILYLIFKQRAKWIIAHIAMHLNLIAILLYFILWQMYDLINAPEFWGKFMLHGMVALIIRTLLTIHKKENQT